eukprot:scpid111571/ scgid34273/ 
MNYRGGLTSSNNQSHTATAVLPAQLLQFNVRQSDNRDHWNTVHAHALANMTALYRQWQWGCADFTFTTPSTTSVYTRERTQQGWHVSESWQSMLHTAIPKDIPDMKTDRHYTHTHT